MALFQVEGWNLKEERVAIGGITKKKSKREKKRDKKLAQAAQAEEQDQIDDEVEDEDEDEEDDDEEVKPAKTTEKIEAKPKSNEETKKIKKRKHEDVEQPKTEKITKAPVVQVAAPVSAPLPVQKLSPLQQKMMAKLSGSRFRWINEQLYTISSESALELIKNQPVLFDEYHQGFRSQVESWPENPVDVFVDQIKLRGGNKQVNAPGGLPGLPNKKIVIADMGCGEAQLSLDVSNFVKQYNASQQEKNNNNNQKKKFQKGGNNRRFPTGGPRSLDIEVHSFDLKKHNDRITVADIKNVPLPDNSCTVVIFCLALMGTNFLDFVKEAYRLLAPRGELWIAEIKSRFTESGEKTKKQEDIGKEFVEALKLNGFFHKNTDNSNKMFTRFEFFKPAQDIINERKAKLERRQKFVEQESEKEELETKRQTNPEGKWLLKPCIYKRR
ncbi:methyltransferase-domain-containing protein [Scheffersomyces coipomensis]|uniref:methyltransferase-domain-containing protein n=1 Tax=Scheffersomyces coipomensis TaxID=1788519 RepID=UPI00315C5157